MVSVSQDVLAKGLTIRANKATNSIFLRLHAADLERIKKLVREYFDVPLPQVKIEARMEILDRTALEAIGIQWGGAGAANVGNATVVGQGFQSPLRPPGTGVSDVNPVNPNLNLGGLLPIFPDTGLPLGGNLVNLPIVRAAQRWRPASRRGDRIRHHRHELEHQPRASGACHPGQDTHARPSRDRDGREQQGRDLPR